MGTSATGNGFSARAWSVVFAVALLFGAGAAAAPPENADPRFTPWYRSLRQPGTGAECCGLADCRAVEFRRSGDVYEVFVDERWRLSKPYWTRVPPEKILERPDNPTGRAVVCFTPEAGVMCFILPPQS